MRLFKDKRDYGQKVKDRFFLEISSILQKYHLQQLVLVLDLHSAFLLTNLFTVSELISINIHYIERLEVKRKRMNCHAVYFIEPTKENVEALIKDFSSKQTEQYHKVHILFTTFVEKSILKEISLNPILLKRIAKNSIKEFYHSNRIIGPNILDLNVRYLSSAFSHDGVSQEIKRQVISKKLVEMVANASSINGVRIYYKKSANMICQRMASSVNRVLKDFLANLVKNKSEVFKKQASDLTFLLLDRSIDTVTPLMHNFSFQALLFDLFDISMVTKGDLKDKGSYSYEEIVNDVYEKYRYKHLSLALSELPQALEDEKGKLEMLKTGEHQVFSIQELDKNVSQLKTNIQKLEMIWKQFKEEKLEEIADLQQCLATGLTSNGENTSSSKLFAEAVEFIQRPQLKKDIKLRLALLCLNCIKLSKHDYESLLGLFAKDDVRILKNIIALGVKYDSSVSKSTKTISKQQQNIAKKRLQQTKMPLNRYTSIIELILPLFTHIISDPLQSKTLDDHVFGELSCIMFPQSEEEGNKFDQKKLAIVMLGGLSWGQISTIRSLPQYAETVIMADFLINPSQYLHQISKIDILKY